MARSLCKPWLALAALLLAPVMAPLSAQAQGQGEERLVRPYPSRGTFISAPPKQFCSEAERQAYIAAAETALALIEADADRARAYFIALRQRYGASQASGNKDAEQAYLRMLREFEHGEESATTGDGPIHHMTVTAPGEVEGHIAAARAAPLIDCSSLEALERRRPQLSPLQLPPLPARLCSEEEREAFRRRLVELVAAARAQIDLTTRYLEAMGGHDGLGWPSPASPESDLALANLRVERAWALDRNLANSRLQYQAEKRLEALAAMQIVPCDTPAEVGTVPGTPLGPVPQRPPLPDGPLPIPATPLCTDLDRRARIEAIDAAIRAANARLVLANNHMLMLGQLSDTATRGKADFFVIQQINEEARSYQIIVYALKAAADALYPLRRDAATRPLDICTPPEPPAGAVTPGTPVRPVPDKPVPSGGGKKACLPGGKRAGRAPISIGSNGRVGSGARTKKKLMSTLGGLAGGLLGGGGGGGGGGKSGPPIKKCKIKDSEKTVFTDPATGISLRVGAKRAGNTVIVFADVANSPDSGTFQGGWVEKPDGEMIAPTRADICEMWGEWSLTVSWTRDTYVDGNLVSHEAGGFNEGGRFSLPGMLSSDSKPAGLWQQLGFSNASHGARKIALSYPLPSGGLTEPFRLLLHVTRPSRNPVDTQPFDLVMTEGAGGFSFAAAPPDEPCVPDPANVTPAPADGTG